MRAFFKIVSIVGTGTDDDAYRPAHTDALTGWAACYKGGSEALVVFQGKVYESLIAANVWSPAVYPAGWKVR
jgi:hypothetical protein